ncbi:uncharacterized protein LOC142588834 [Dermacentor variabilis]|uniref:uncharacterized protein LOC142588834 n=1 Tax=Dermacentor variabilis TaxID=34621 RepID=UPI003F5CB917
MGLSVATRALPSELSGGEFEGYPREADDGFVPVDEGLSKGLIIVLLFVLLLLGTVLFYFVTSSGAEDGNLTGEGGATKSGGGGGGGEGSTQPYLKLTCTFGPTGVLAIQLPPDKLCDFIFYTHMIYDIKTRAIGPQYGLTAFSLFFKASNSYNFTTFGVSLAVSLMPAFPPDEEVNIQHALTDLFREKVMHFGALDVDVSDYPVAKSGGLQYLKAST